MRLAWNRAWALSLMLGLGFLLIGLLIWIFFKVTVPSPVREGRQTEQVQTHPEEMAPTSPQPKATAPPQSPADSLESQLEQVVDGIRAANQKKDLPQLLGYYSSNFPQLTQRAQTISKAWKIYDYPKMDFEIHEVKLLSDNRARARVTWHAEVKKIHDSKTKEVSTAYLINFIKESGQWRILSTEPIK